MTADSVSRRDVLRSLSTVAVAGSVLQAIPLEAAEYLHKMIETEKTSGKAGNYTPKFFEPHSYETLKTLCETILPADSDSGGAIEAGAPEFIDLLTSENSVYQLTLGGGLMWLNSACTDLYGSVYLDCTSQEQKEMLDRIAYRRNVAQDKSLSYGVEFFALLRNLTSDGFFTSKIGIAYLGYIGNAFVLDFPGCPPVPGL